MAAVTSRETRELATHQSKFNQLEIRIRCKFGPYSGLAFRSVIFSLASPWIKINCKGTVMLWFDCRPTLIRLKTSSTSRAVFWLFVESRIYKENKNNTVNWVAIASQTPLRAIGQTTRTVFYTPRPWQRPSCIFYFRTIAWLIQGKRLLPLCSATYNLKHQNPHTVDNKEPFVTNLF